MFQKKSEYAGSRFFQNSGILLQVFQRKILKMQAADSSKILVRMYRTVWLNFLRHRNHIYNRLIYWKFRVSTALYSKLTSKYATECSRNPTKHRSFFHGSLWDYIECGGKSECCMLRYLAPQAFKGPNWGWRSIGSWLNLNTNSNSVITIYLLTAGIT